MLREERPGRRCWKGDDSLLILHANRQLPRVTMAQSDAPPIAALFQVIFDQKVG
jgi:hypothetical protein